MNDVFDTVREGVLTVDDDWRITDGNSTAGDLLDRDVATLCGADIRTEFPRSVETPFRETSAGLESGRDETTFEEYFPGLDRWLEVRIRQADQGAAIHLWDITEQQRLRRESETRRVELATLTRLNSIIQEILQSLVGATTREEIEQLISERLATAELYTFAWIAERDAATEQLTVRTKTGEHADLVELIREHSGGSDSGLEAAAITTGEPQTAETLGTAASIPDAVRREAFARGLQSALSVPLVYGNTVYGALGVYASRQDAFSPRERRSFETLGKLTGFAITATRQRNLLLSDTVIELTFQVTDTDACFVAVSARLGCQITIEGIVPRSERALLSYVRVDGATADEFLDVAADQSAVDVDRVVHDHGTECLLAVTVSDASPTLWLAERGATIRTAEFDDGVGEIAAEVSPEEDIQELVEELQTEFAATELLSKLEHDRAVETAQEFQSELHDQLTKRQRAVLRAAYFADYFESPRGSTAEEVADTLDISSPTLHNHLRAAQRKLLEAFFDEDETATDGSSQK